MPGPSAGREEPPAPQKSIKLNIAMNLAKIAVAMAFQLVTFPYATRVLGPEGFGKVNFALSFVGYFILLASIGIPNYGIREVARIRDDKPALAALVQELLVLHALASVACLLAYLGVVVFHSRIQAETMLFLVVGLSIPLSMLTMEWLYQGLEEYVYITLRTIALSALSTVALFLFVRHEGHYVINAAIAVVASLGSSVLNFWNARRLVFSSRDRPWSLWRHIKPLGLVYSLGLITSIYVHLDIVMLGFMAPARDVGYYSSAIKLTRMALAVVASFSGVLLPRLAWYVANGRRAEFDEMLRKSLGMVLLICIPCTATLLAFNREIILALAGPSFLPAAACLAVTSPIILFIGLTSVFGMQVLYPLGREKDVVVSVALGGAMALGLNALLIPRFAYLGAAISTLCAEFTVLVAQLLLVRRVHALCWPWNSATKSLMAALAAVALLVIGRAAFPHAGTWARLLVGAPAAAGIYLLGLFLLREELLGELIAKTRSRLGFH